MSRKSKCERAARSYANYLRKAAARFDPTVYGCGMPDSPQRDRYMARLAEQSDAPVQAVFKTKRRAEVRTKIIQLIDVSANRAAHSVRRVF